MEHKAAEEEEDLRAAPASHPACPLPPLTFLITVH